jgi:hypothetical protein
MLSPLKVLPFQLAVLPLIVPIFETFAEPCIFKSSKGLNYSGISWHDIYPLWWQFQFRRKSGGKPTKKWLSFTSLLSANSLTSFLARGIHVREVIKLGSSIRFVKVLHGSISFLYFLLVVIWFYTSFTWGQEGKVVPVLHWLSTMPWRRMGEWMCRSKFSWLWL